MCQLVAFEHCNIIYSSKKRLSNAGKPYYAFGRRNWSGVGIIDWDMIVNGRKFSI